MTTLNGLPLQVLLTHALIVLTPLLVLFTIFWVGARRRLAREARKAGVVQGGERGGVEGTSPPAERARRDRRFG